MSEPHRLTGVCLPRETSTGRLLTQARAKRKLRQQDIAEKVGCRRGYIMQVETGRRGIPGHQVLAFARAYDCDALALLRALERDRTKE